MIYSYQEELFHVPRLVARRLTSMLCKIATWLDNIRDTQDRMYDRAYEEALRQLIRAVKEEPRMQLLNRVAVLERATLLQRMHSTTRQQARFFYQAGSIYAHYGLFSLAHEAFMLCQHRIRVGDTNAMYHLHLLWAPVTYALRYHIYAYRSYRFIIALSDRLHLLSKRNYQQAQQRCKTLYPVLPQEVIVRAH